MSSLIAKAVEVIQTTVNPLTQPLGIKLINDEKALPQKFKTPRQLGHKYAICQAVGAARRFGWTMVVSKEDHSCALCSVLLGFAPENEFFKEGHLACGMYTETLEAGAKSEEVLPKFKFNEYKYILIAPLARMEDVPDVIMIYGFPAQIMRLVHGALYKTGGALTSSFTGRGGYGGIIAGTLQKDSCQVILPGNGERVFAHTQDYEMAFTIPGTKLEEVIYGLEATHKAGVRYPIPSFINYEAPFPPKYIEFNNMLEK